MTSTSSSSSPFGSANDSLSEDDLVIEMGAKAPSSARPHHKNRYSFQKRPFIIGVAGGTSSGKSTVCSKIMAKLGPIDPTSVYLSHEKRVVVISQDSFYRKLNDNDRAMVATGNFNFDHPEAFDLHKMVKTMHDIFNGRMVKVSIYDYKHNEISDEEQTIYPADVVLVEGLLLFYFPELCKMFNMKIFVDTDPDTRLSRRVMKDVQELNRQLDVVLTQYTKFVKPSFEEFCLPTKKYADIIVPRGPDNEVAVDLIVAHVRGIYDPSVRHESIHLDNFDNGQVLVMAGRKFKQKQEPKASEEPVVRTAKEALSKSKSSLEPAVVVTGIPNVFGATLNGHHTPPISRNIVRHKAAQLKAKMLNETSNVNGEQPGSTSPQSQKILVATCQ